MAAVFGTSPFLASDTRTGLFACARCHPSLEMRLLLLLVDVLDHRLLLLIDGLIRELACALVRLNELLQVIYCQERELGWHLLALGFQTVLDPNVDILDQIHKRERAEHLAKVVLDPLDVFNEDLASLLHCPMIQGKLDCKLTDLVGTPISSFEDSVPLKDLLNARLL